MDYGNVHAALSRLIGVQKSELKELGIGESFAKGMMSGKSFWGRPDAVVYLGNRTHILATRLRQSFSLIDIEEGDSLCQIEDLSPIETAAGWLTFTEK